MPYQAKPTRKERAAVTSIAMLLLLLLLLLLLCLCVCGTAPQVAVRTTHPAPAAARVASCSRCCALIKSRVSDIISVRSLKKALRAAPKNRHMWSLWSQKQAYLVTFAPKTSEHAIITHATSTLTCQKHPVHTYLVPVSIR